MLLRLVLFYSVFSAAALLVLGSFGITPGLMPAAMFIGIFCLSYFNGVRYPAQRTVLLLMLPFILVIFGALCSSIIMPRLFEDEVLVWPQKVSAFLTRSPLAPNSGNITQDLYLLADTLLAITAASYLTRPGPLLAKLMDCYLIAGIIAAGISFWQFAGTILHIPYPTTVFLSNPGWALLSDQSVGWLIRLNGPFSEPAALASYMCGTLSASGWVMLNGDRRALPRLAFWSALIVVLLTTASTGYITLLAMCSILVLHAVCTANLALRRRVAVRLVCGVAIAGFMVVLLPAVAPGLSKEAALVWDGTVNKTQSSSYQERSTLDADGLQEMHQTYGLGVGWGSNRSSSLLPGLCATIGVWGVGGLSWFAVVLVRQARRAVRLTVDPILLYAMKGSAAALISNLISNLISGPTISSPDFYLLLAMLVAAIARAQHEAVVFSWYKAAIGHQEAGQVRA